MLIDMILACAPVVVALPAVFTLLASRTSFASKAHLQKRLYGSLLLAEKLPPSAVGAPQIAHDIDRQTMLVAYVAQHPQRAHEIAHVAVIGAVALATLVGYYLLLADDADFITGLIALAAFAFLALWLERALLNFTRNDALARELFGHFRAPAGLIRPRTELIAKVPALSVDDVFERAAGVRDANHAGTMSTMDAVNAVLAKAHSHFDWRLEGQRLVHRIADADYRANAMTAVRWMRTDIATGYDFLLRHLVDPFFTWRLTFLDSRERDRTAKAQKTGDVFEAAWLPTHYRNERHRVAEHLAHLHKVRDPLLAWSGTGAPPTTPVPLPDLNTLSLSDTR